MKGKYQIIYTGNLKSPSKPPKGRRREYQHYGRFMTPLEEFWDAFGFWVCIIASVVFMYFFVFGSPEVTL